MSDMESDEQVPEYPAYPESAEQAGEYFRLAIAFLSTHKLALNPHNYCLAYHYIGRFDPMLNEAVDRLLGGDGGWSDEAASDLFGQYVCHCNTTVLRHLREELLTIVAHTLGTMIDLTGKTSMTNRRIKEHIDILAKSESVESVMSAVSSIISETRSLMRDTSSFEANLRDTANEVERLRSELDYARREATQDPLTGVLNRRGFDQVLAASILQARRQHKGNFCLFLLDIDLFKDVNDNYGHLLGDKVLRAVAELLIKHTKGKDSCARFGGDEFAVLLPETGFDNAANLAENLRRIINKITLKRPNSGATIGGISVSIGVATYRTGETPEDFVHRCDQALYSAKSRGRNRVVLAD